MARRKSALRRRLNGRYLRWQALVALVRLVPPLGRALAFFPRHVGLIEGADRVLADEARPIPAEEFSADMPFLARTADLDARAPGLTLPDGVVTGRRTALYRKAWIDMATASILLPDRARTVLVRGEVANWNAISARLGRPRIAIEGRAFAPLVTANYFHQLLENGVRLLDLLDSGVVSDQPLTIVKQTDRTRVETALFDGIAAADGVTIRRLPEHALALPDEAVAHFPPDNYWEWPPVDRAAADRLAGVFDRLYGAAARAAGPPRLYLSRAGARIRTPRNEEALAAALAGEGFETFTASDTNHPDQIARFRAADTVVAVHGAGLTNLLFCRPGTQVIEIFPGNFVKSPYWMLARRLGLGYRPVFGGPGDGQDRFDVDLAELAAALKETG